MCAESHQYRPTRSREVLRKFGAEPPKPPISKRPLPRIVCIGQRRGERREIRLDRPALYERVWSEPMTTVAATWDMSGRGLAKPCRRLKIPVPPRGYWAKLQAGKKPRRPRLPAMTGGEAQEVIVWVPE